MVATSTRVKEVILTPKQALLLRYAYDEETNIIFYGGSIRGGKTFGGLLALLSMCNDYPGSRWLVVRKDFARLRLTTMPVFFRLIEGLKYEVRHNVVRFQNGSEIVFFAENYDRDKDLNRFRGLEINGALLEEANELQEDTYLKVLERCGTLFLARMPKRLIILTSNPADNWVKRRFYDTYKAGRLAGNIRYIEAGVFDNPYLPPGFVDGLKDLPAPVYKRFVLGDWEVQLKPEDAFYYEFEEAVHTGTFAYESGGALHFSIDENVMPFMSCSVFQISDRVARMIDFIKAKNLDDLVQKILSRYGSHRSGVFIYGDATSQRRNTYDSRSLYAVFSAAIQPLMPRLRVLKHNPGIPIRGYFVNKLFREHRLFFDSSLKDVIYEFCTIKTGADGKKLIEKAYENGKSYERNGHISDTVDYFVCSAFWDEFRRLYNVVQKTKVSIPLLRNTHEEDAQRFL